MANVLITGATGFIGTHLTVLLAERGDTVRCLVRPTAAADRVELLRNLGAQTVPGDVGDPASLASAVDGVDVIYHLAGRTKAITPTEFHEVNEQGVDAVARACAESANPPVLIVVSSLAAAGPSRLDCPLTETDPARPVSHYGKSKRAGELAAARWAGQAPISIVRPPIVFGQRDTDVYLMFRLIHRLHLHAVPSFRAWQFSAIHADDLARGLALVVNRGERLEEGSDATGQGVYYVTDPERSTYAELGRLISAALGQRRLGVIPVPMPLMWIASAAGQSFAHLTGRQGIVNLDKYREAAAGHWTCSADKIGATLGFAPAASLTTRLRETAEWYRNAGWL